MPPIRCISLSGDPYTLGQTHGNAYQSDITAITEERIRLCYDGDWGSALVTRQIIDDLADACLTHQQQYDEATTAELTGIADATGIPLRDVLLMNGFTDFVDAIRAAGRSLQAKLPPIDDPGNCTALLSHASTTADGKPYLAQTWDMHATATPYVIMLDIQPEASDQTTPRCLAFTLTGCIGMIGLNAHGLAIGINNLMTTDGQPGVVWTTALRRMLREESADAALNVLKQTQLCGAHNYLILDATGTGYNVEASPTQLDIKPLTASDPLLMHTNHCLGQELINLQDAKSPPSLASSHKRLSDAQAFVATHTTHGNQLTPESLKQLLGTRGGTLGEPETPENASICHGPMEGYNIETSGAVLISPQDRIMHAAWGQPDQSTFESFNLNTD